MSIGSRFSSDLREYKDVWTTSLFAMFIDTSRHDVSDNYIGAALKTVATVLDDPPSKSIPIKHVDTHYPYKLVEHMHSCSQRTWTNTSKSWAAGTGKHLKNLCTNSLPTSPEFVFIHGNGGVINNITDTVTTMSYTVAVSVAVKLSPATYQIHYRGNNYATSLLITSTPTDIAIQLMACCSYIC
jgi:hypothetical protein